MTIIVIRQKFLTVFISTFVSPFCSFSMLLNLILLLRMKQTFLVKSEFFEFSDDNNVLSYIFVFTLTTGKTL